MHEAKVVAHSVSPQGVEVVSLITTIPRVVLAEFNTHRVFSRNSASSRAIPFHKQLEKVRMNPFVPDVWTKNEPGMQGTDFFKDDEKVQCQKNWLWARDESVIIAKQLDEIGLHKQDISRLLEPWMWQTILVTSTEWDNFLKLRAPNRESSSFDPTLNIDLRFPADPKIQPASFAIKQALSASTPRLLEVGEWHLPFWDDDDRESEWHTHITEVTTRHGTVNIPTRVLITVGRCARISYLTHDGSRDPVEDIRLAKSLLFNNHWSPWEHVATPMENLEWGLRNAFYKILSIALKNTGIAEDPSNMLFSGNFRGWRQARKLFPMESGQVLKNYN